MRFIQLHISIRTESSSSDIRTEPLKRSSILHQRTVQELEELLCFKGFVQIPESNHATI
jgi:hypothetical protein